MAIIKEKKIKITSVIENLDQNGLTEGEPEKTETTSDGFYKIAEDSYLIMYSEQTDGGRVVSDIEIRDNFVSVKRRGGLESNLLFTEGESHKSLYTIPPYSFDVEIITKKIRNNLTRDGGRLDIFYTMKIGGQDKNIKMKIEI